MGGRNDVTMFLNEQHNALWSHNTQQHLPQIKHVFLRISSFCCFSLLKSANVSMITPKMRLRTIMMTMKKNSRSYTTRTTNSGSWKQERQIITLRPRQNGRHFEDNILKCIFFFKNVLYFIALIWIPQHFIDKATVVQVMAWCHQAISYYLNQCWPRSMSPYAIIRPQWVNHSGAETRIIWAYYVNVMAADARLLVS